MSDKPLDCVGVPADGVGKHDFELQAEKAGPHLFGTIPRVSGLVVTADSESELSAEAINGLAALLTAERERNAALQTRLDAIRSVLVPIAEDEWQGQWRVVRAIELMQS